MVVKSLRNVVHGALFVALALGAGLLAQAQENESDGKVVRIGSSDGEKTDSRMPRPLGRTWDPSATPSEMPKYWIGLMGGPINADDPLRAHVDLPAGEGLLVVDVVADPPSPAAKAGVQKHDILLRANGAVLRDMRELVDLVASEGEKKDGQIKLDILRRNKPETLTIAPEERPATAAASQLNPNVDSFNFQNGDVDQLRDLFEQFGGQFPGQFPPQLRNFGNGVIVGGGGLADVPNGVSISVQKQNDEPAQITVKRGDDTWTITGDDPEALKQLPEDLRPLVEQMLRGNNRHVPMPGFGGPAGTGFGDGGLRDRLEQMERRIEEMQKRLGRHPAESTDEAAQ